MACFTKAEIDAQYLDWMILRDGGVALYHREKILLDDVKTLESYGYRIVLMDCSEWRSNSQMHTSLEAALNFPSYYGQNLDALNDCMTNDIDVPTPGGLALVLRNLDRCQEVKPEITRAISIFAKASREHMLTGHRFITLIQTNDPREGFDSLACVAAIWNRHEWLNVARGL